MGTRFMAAVITHISISSLFINGICPNGGINVLINNQSFMPLQLFSGLQCQASVCCQAK